MNSNRILIVFPIRYPINNEPKISRIRKLIKVRSKGVLLINDFAVERLIANKIMTKTSLMMVTLSAVCVKGPFAFTSLIIAIAEDGDLDTKMVPIRMQMAIFVLYGILDKSGI